MQAAQLEPAIHDRRLAGLEEALHPLEVRLAKRRRDDRLGEVAADRLLARPAERLLGLRVPGDDDAVGVHADEGVVRGVEDQVRAGVALRHLRSALRGGARRRSRRAIRFAVEMAKFCSSTVHDARAADVLGAEHADHVAAAAQRHVEHRARC